MAAALKLKLLPCCIAIVPEQWQVETLNEPDFVSFCYFIFPNEYKTVDQNMLKLNTCTQAKVVLIPVCSV